MKHCVLDKGDVDLNASTSLLTGFIENGHLCCLTATAERLGDL